MWKIFKSKKALSPVVAAIILIAVTVAVSIAVAAWMGALTFTFMKTEAIEVLDYSWDTTARAYVDLKLKNTGTGTTTINEIRANNIATSLNGTTADHTLDPGDVVWIRVTYAFTAGTRYEFTMVAASGTRFPSFIATCP